jgi:hypothetical protein
MNKETVRKLKEVGFCQSDKYPHVFSHELLGDLEFDFSAASDAGTIYIVAKAHYELGKEDAKKEIRKSLGIID